MTNDQPSETAMELAKQVWSDVEYRTVKLAAALIDKDREAFAARKVEEYAQTLLSDDHSRMTDSLRAMAFNNTRLCVAKDAEIACLKAQVNELEDISRGLIHWDNNGRSTAGTILFDRLRAALASTAE